MDFLFNLKYIFFSQNPGKYIVYFVNTENTRVRPASFVICFRDKIIAGNEQN